MNISSTHSVKDSTPASSSTNSSAAARDYRLQESLASSVEDDRNDSLPLPLSPIILGGGVFVSPACFKCRRGVNKLILYCVTAIFSDIS